MPRYSIATVAINQYSITHTYTHTHMFTVFALEPQQLCVGLVFVFAFVFVCAFIDVFVLVFVLVFA